MTPKEYYIKNKKRMSSKMKEWRFNHKDYLIKYRSKNKDKIKKAGADWRKKNKNKTKKDFKTWYEKNRKSKLEKNKIWVANNLNKRRKYRNEYQKNRRQNDFKFKLDQNIGNFIKLSIKQKKDGMKWERMVGYSVSDLIIHLEKQFSKNMCWNNYCSYWQVDHKKPRSWFKYNSYKDIEFKKCWSLSNLQPMIKEENNKKGNKYESK